MNSNLCHDWTLVGLSMNWKLGELVFEMRDPSSNVRSLIAKDVTSLDLPRKYPWGPSVSINMMTRRQDERGNVLQIEMQSGDTIECVADSFAFRDSGS